MRIMPFMKRKKGVQFAGIGLDTGGGGSGWKLPDFSTTEQPLGLKWIDGKDLYIKSLHVEKPSSSDLHIDIGFVDTILLLSASQISTTGTTVYIPRYYGSSNYMRVDFWKKDTNDWYVNIQSTSGGTFDIIIMYTKQ